MGKIKRFIYNQKDILFIIAILLLVKTWSAIKDLLRQWWPLLLIILVIVGAKARRPIKSFLKSFFRQWGRTFLVAVILALTVRTFIIQPFKIPTGSMRPTLMEGDHIFVNKFIYGARIPFSNFRLPALRRIQRGDVVVFKYPLNPKKDFIKRVVALEMETVKIENGNILINGSVVNEPPIFRERYYYNYGRYGAKDVEIRVPKGFFYVLGDNTASSKDSRYWGFVSKQAIVGQAFLIYWPPFRIRVIR